MAHPSPVHVSSGRSGVQRLHLGSSLVLYLLENEAILYSARSRSLFGLDGSATALLLRLADGEALESLTAGFDTSARGAAKALADMVAGREPLGEEYSAEIFCADVVPHGTWDSRRYRLMTTGFTIDCPDETLRKTVASSLRHLLVPDEEAIDLAIGIVPAGPLWQLYLNGTAQEGAVPADMLLPKLYDRLRKQAYQRLPYLLAVHAAVVSDGSRTIIFPGKSGSGKSTLAATLLARGYRLFSDEVAVLTESGELVPIPLGLGLKSGSWPLLERDYPVLATTAEHVRWDNSRVRYLEPAAISFARKNDGRRATHLCFPVYQPHGPGRLETLTPVTALRCLTEAGYQIRGLHEESAERIVTWLQGLSCNTLTYSSTRESLQLLDMAMNIPSSSAKGDVAHGGYHNV